MQNMIPRLPRASDTSSEMLWEIRSRADESARVTHEKHRGWQCKRHGCESIAFIAMPCRGLVSAHQEVAQEAVTSDSSHRDSAGKPVTTRRAAVASASAAAEGGAAPKQAAADRSTIEMVERAVFLHHPYENRERLRSILPRKTGVQALNRALEYLERAGKIAIEGEAIHWAAGAAGPSGGGDGAPAADDKSILAGTCLEWIEEGKLPTETIGEYIVRVSNAHEPGSYTAEDARELDDSMRRAARGESYTHEQVWKEYGL